MATDCLVTVCSEEENGGDFQVTAVLYGIKDFLPLYFHFFGSLGS